MIPVRVCMKGFMSYRECTELCFDGASIWMLTGENGAGKSTIFDAMTFALYGLHRGGKQQIDQLINTHSDSMMVEFDFLLGEDSYRVKRTVQRRGRSTYQAFHLQGHTLKPARSGPQPIPQTDNKAGLDNWVEQQLGMNADAFVMSVVLQQGKSDALLEATPAKRHEMLKQLVDLSAYERLYERAEARQKQAQAATERCQRELETLEPVDEMQITALAETVTQAEIAVQSAQQRLRDLAVFKVQAEQWDRLHKEREELQAALAKDESLFAHAEQIELDAARLAELEVVLPQIEMLARDIARHDEHTTMAHHHTRAAAEWQERLDEATEHYTNARTQLEHLECRLTTVQHQHDEAQQALLDLASHIYKLDELQAVREDLERSNQQLTSFSDDLDDQIKHTQHKLDELSELRVVLPELRRFAEARQRRYTAVELAGKANAQHEQHTQQLTKIEQEQRHTQNQLEQTTVQVRSSAMAFTKAETLFDEATQRLARFTSLEGEQTCSYCGQPLSPEHRAAEHERLAREVAERRDEYEMMKVAREAAEAAQKEDEQRVKDAATACKRATDEVQKCVREIREAEQEQHRAAQDGQQALIVLPALYHDHIGAEHSNHVACFTQSYPTDDMLEDYGRMIGQYEAVKHQCDELQRSERQRGEQRAQRETHIHKLELLRQNYSTEREQTLRMEHGQVRQQQRAAKQQLNELAQPRSALQEQCKQHQQAKEHAERQHRLSQGAAERAAIQSNEARRAIDERKQMLAEGWRSALELSTPEQVQMWQAERNSLVEAKAHQLALQHAQEEHAHRTRRLTQITQECAALPAEAQRPCSAIKHDEALAHQQHNEAERRYREASRQHLMLTERCERRKIVEAEQREAARREVLAKQLTRFLGRDYLQRHLLQQAEMSIVVYANAMLDQCSSGSLRLELRQQDDVQQNGSAQKAFDLIAHNSDTSTEPLLAWLLSGSQRFRVAVSLALGIGQYASQHTRRMESVIIDEGFGSLDRTGRRDMIDALRDLSGTIHRIILVSHQEEFADAFPNCYAVPLAVGTSRVPMLDQA